MAVNEKKKGAERQEGACKERIHVQFLVESDVDKKVDDVVLY